jgi:Raf kinase inhibitor-like YbhB/YbcL family protein
MQGTPSAIAVESAAFAAGASLPRDYTADGRNISPPLSWRNVPPGTKELAVMLEDPDAGNPPPFVHWVLYKIPASATGLPEELPIDSNRPMPPALTGAVQGVNGFRRNNYRGPAPPPGAPHHYRFVMYALDAPMPGEPGLTRAQLLDAMKGHVIGQGELVALYGRTGPAEGAAPSGGRGRGRGRG